MPGSDAVPPGLLEIVWRRRWVAALAVIVCLAAALTYLTQATPIFTSTSRLYVEQSGPKIMSEQEGVMTRSSTYLYTQAELLKSTPILGGAVDRPEVKRMKTLGKVDNPVGYFKNMLEVEVGKKDDIISVSLDSPYPEEAAQIVNAVVDSYVTYQASRKRSTAAEVLNILQKEKLKRDEELAGRYKAILEFKQSDDALSLEDEHGNILVQGLARLSEALTEARINTINFKAAYEAAKLMINEPAKLKQLVEAQSAGRGYLSLSQETAQLSSELSRLELQLSDLKRKITDDHPAVRALESKIDKLRNLLNGQEKKTAEAYLEVARQQWIAAKQQEGEIQSSFDNQRQQAQQINAKAAQYAMLQSELNRTEKLCDILDSRIKELNVTEDVGALNISILEAARPGDKPTKPAKARIMAMALVLGLMLGVGLALMLDWIDHRLRSAEEISAILGVPVLGVVPTMQRKETDVARGRKVCFDSTSPVAEAYRTIRTAIYFGIPSGRSKTLLVTSPAPGDGKTTLVSNLAIAMAQAGQRTLVLDADFRRPRQHEIFEIDDSQGLSDVLTGQGSVDEVLRESGIEGLDILPCGPVPPNPSELLNSNAFADLIKDLATKYDRIVIDSPPVMPVADARILAALCDVTLVVLRAEKSSRKISIQARDGLMSVGARILGAVVNDVARGKDRYGYYGGYGYGYGHYGGSDRKGKREHRTAERERSVSAASTTRDPL